MESTTLIPKAGERTQEIQRTNHIVVALGVFEGLEDQTLEDCFGNNPSASDIRAEIKRMCGQGFTYFPANGCDNYDSKGVCLGHDKL